MSMTKVGRIMSYGAFLLKMTRRPRYAEVVAGEEMALLEAVAVVVQVL